MHTCVYACSHTHKRNSRPSTGSHACLLSQYQKAEARSSRPAGLCNKTLWKRGGKKQRERNRERGEGRGRKAMIDTEGITKRILWELFASFYVANSVTLIELKHRKLWIPRANLWKDRRSKENNYRGNRLRANLAAKTGSGFKNYFSVYTWLHMYTHVCVNLEASHRGHFSGVSPPVCWERVSYGP